MQETVRPYYSGWVLAKESNWMDDLNNHILICNQVINKKKRGGIFKNMP